VVVRRSPAPYADEGNVQLLAGSVLAAERAAFQDEQAGAGGTKEVASLHEKPVTRGAAGSNGICSRRAPDTNPDRTVAHESRPADLRDAARPPESQMTAS